jgi:UDP-MurNAc hydroxylase
VKFTILSHAGLAIEHEGVQLVCDPWLIGSCYWRSWWNFPEPPRELIDSLAPDYIYLTHLHWDHFHGPSLQKLFKPSTTIVVPKVPTLRMVRDLEWLGFRNIIEVAHGQQIELGTDFLLRSYQFGVTVDSAIVVSGGGNHLFNCNDAKFFGLPLRQIIDDYPKIDFIFRSHSSATPIPFCVDNYERLLPPSGHAEYDSAEQFVRCALYVGARYAIPFASNHCFLHRDTQHFNATATTPEDVRKRYEAAAEETHSASECMVMPPGSSWSDADGFSIVSFDFSEREKYIEAMQERYRDKLDLTYREEANAVADFSGFKKYFDDFMRSIPGFLRRRFLSRLVFRTSDSNGIHNWLIDPIASHVEPVPVAPADCIVLEVHPKVLNDCVAHRMFSVWSASKRLRIYLPNASSLSRISTWLAMFDFYEVDMLPLHKNLSPRALAIRVRRWREPVEVMRILFRRLVLRRRFSVNDVYQKRTDLHPAA